MEKNEIPLLALTGFLIGMLFPAITLPLLLAKDDLPLSWAGLVAIHETYPNLWVVDLAPIFLALFLAFIQEKKVQHPVAGPEQPLVQTMAGTSVIVSVISFISLFLPGNEVVNLALAIPIIFCGAFLGSLLYLYQPVWLVQYSSYLGGLFPVLFISLLMFTTGGVESRYFFLLLIVLFFGIAFNGVMGFVINAIYVTLGLLSPLLYTASASFYFEYLLSTIPFFLLMGFVFLQAFELKRRDAVLEETYKQLLAAEKKAAVKTLARTTAHEIFNRLTPIAGFANLLQKLPPDDPHFKKAIQEIQKQSREIEKIVASMKEVNPEETVTFGGKEIYDLSKKEGDS